MHRYLPKRPQRRDPPTMPAMRRRGSMRVTWHAAGWGSMLRSPVFFLLASALFLVSACGTITQELEQEDAASAAITIQIKARLVEAENVDAAAVLVELKDDVVVLSGFVASEDEALEVVRIAEAEAGEYSIRNQIEIK